MPNKFSPVPTKSQTNCVLQKFPTRYQQYLIGSPKRYRRCKENTTRVWLRISCQKHGPYANPVRFDTLKKYGPRCEHCGRERRIERARKPLKIIREQINDNAKKLGIKVKVLRVTYAFNRKPIIELDCKRHGVYSTTLDKAVSRSQLCRLCGLERLRKVRLIPFKDKKKAYKKRYPNSTLLLLEQRANSQVFVKCGTCGNKPVMNWSNLFHSGSGCRTCSVIRAAEQRSRPFESIKKEFKQLGLEILGDYKNTHTKCLTKCNTCGKMKQIKPNTVLSRKNGFSCNCTQRIPDYCRDIIASDLMKFIPDLIEEKDLSLGKDKFKPDIYSKTKKLIIEVKYGDSPFGDKRDALLVKERLAHVKKQAAIYGKLRFRIVYLIISEKRNMVYVPRFLNRFEHYYLNNLDKFTIYGKKTLSPKTIDTLHLAYRGPSFIRDVKNKELPIYNKIRKVFFCYLVSNKFIYPSQRIIRQKFGFSQRVLDHALGLGRHASMEERVKILKDCFNFNVIPERRIRGKPHIVHLSLRDQKLFNMYLKQCEKLERPLMPLEVRLLLGIPESRVRRWLGIPHGANRKNICEALQSRGLNIDYIPLIKGISRKEMRSYKAERAKAKKLGHCVLCRNVNAGETPICDRCHRNASILYKGKPRPRRALLFIKNRGDLKFSQRGSEEFRKKIREARLKRCPPKY